MKNLEKARELGNGLLQRRRRHVGRTSQDIRELTNDLCLRTDGKIRRRTSTRSSSGR